jgi:pilin isopeptide linkage protein
VNDHKGKKHISKRLLSLWRRALSMVLTVLMVLGSSGGQVLASAAELSTPNPIDLESYLTDKTTLEITVYIDGVKRIYTPQELTQKGLEVPKGAPVKVELYFNTISNVEKGQTLEYQLPENLMDYSGANEYGYVWQDTVWEENNAGAEVEAADWTIDKTGKLTVTIRDDFFENNKHTDDNTVDLFGFNIKFSGSFSSERGEHSGNGDNEVTFRGETNGTGKISFTIPFEYKNEHANAEVAKELVSFDPTTRKASYKITVTAPETNSYATKNVVVTDKVEGDVNCIETYTKDKVKYTYRDCVASTGSDTFDATTGVWTIGDMEPGQVETLTYSLVIDKGVYKSGELDIINNVATVKFNDDGVNEAYATLDLPNAILNKSVLTDKNGVVLTTENGETYATYTLTVSADNGGESNITVKDAFDDPTRIKKIEAPDGASVGTVTIDNSTASLTWKINTLKKGETATLTYRAYLNPNAWQTTQDPYNPGTVALKINNNASMYIGHDETGEPAIADSDSISSTIRKTWVKKNGELITDSKDEKNGKLKYTVVVNSDPVSANITSIYDTLTAGGTYESGGNIELYRYTSSDKETLVDETTIPLSEVVSTDGSGYRWDIDLVSRGLNGAYYYEVVYYVESSSIQVSNNAGIGFGVGPGYGIGTQVQGAGGMTYKTDYWKSPGTDNKQEAYTPWTVTVQKTVPKGAVYVDRLSAAYVYQHEQFWFDDDCLNDIEITFDGKTLVQGVDYTVKGVINDDTGYASKTDPEGKRYNQFEITFNNEYQATSSNKLIISYKQRLNTTAHDEDVSYSDGCMKLSYNYCKWLLPEYGKLVATAEGANYDRSYYDWNTPLKKSDGTYNEDDGTITWNITLNTQTTVDGDATLEEYLPEGLSFVSAQITQRPFSVLTKDTVLGDITQEEYTNDDGKTCTKVNIQVKNLFAYLVTSSKFETGVGPYTGWTRAGEVTVTVVTKVDDEWRLNLTKDTKLTNKAVLTDNDTLPKGGITATGTSTVPSSKLIDKSMIGRDIPTYIEYALNVNPDADNLLPGTDDTLQIVDIMGAGMSLSNTHSNNFKVYDVTNVTDLLDSDGNVVASKAQTGTDITDQCSVVNITGQHVDGMTDDEVGKPAYLITIPDGKHVAIVYWATFEGAEDESVEVTNRASFFYNNKMLSGNVGETSDQVVASDASSSLFVGSFFYLHKTDQWGNTVPDVTYTLYEVTMDSSGNVTDKTKIMTKTTVSDESLYFGHRSSDNSSVPQLYKNRLYCLVEESAPPGYAINSAPYYFEFKEKGSDIVNHPNATELHQFVSGGTYDFTNKFTAASYSVPVKKIINGKELAASTEFAFTLKQVSNDSNVVYTDADCTTTFPTNGITTKINGSGETLFDNLYFAKTGTYTFTLTENDLSTLAINNGYTKDSSTFKITIVVDCSDDNELYIKSASYVLNDSTDASTEIGSFLPTFNNETHLTGTITLNATKEVTNRAKPVQAGEFAFTVSVGGEVIAEKNADNTTKIGEDGKPVKKLFYTEDGGNIKIDIDIDQDDVGTQTYVISEVTGSDPTIKYTTDRVRVKVTIAETGDGHVAATNYDYLTEPVFTNEYKAEGSVTLEGTKVLQSTSAQTPLSVYKGEFNFIVKEGDTQVATGYNEADGSITFTAITYNESDIGVHTYYISEKNEGKAFIEYTSSTVKVQVTVTDAGDGKLATDVKYVDGTLDENGHALFTNKSTLFVPTGINLDVVPYVLIVGVVGIAAGIGILIIVCRRKRKL